MTTDPAADPMDRPLLPPESDAGVGPLRWVVTGVALVLLVVGAWRAYEWFTADVERRRAMAEGTAPEPQAAPARSVGPETREPPSDAPSREAAPAAPVHANKPPGPAVTSLEGVNKCVVDGHVTYTNAPCPDGASLPVPEPAVVGADANGVPGLAGDAPAVVARPAVFGAAGDPSQHTAWCNYLTAEIDRLRFEFEQPLPPPVVDHISTRLSGLRAQQAEARCATGAKPGVTTAEVPPADRKTAAAPERKRPAPRLAEDNRGR